MKSSPKNSARRPASGSVRAATAAQVKALSAVLKVCPPDTKETEAALKTSLKLHGQLTPILRQRGRIVDGYRRLRLLKQLNMTPWIVDIDLAPVRRDGTLELPADGLGRAFVEINSCRREFNDAVRAAMADTLATLKKGDNQHTGSAASMSRAAAARFVRSSADSLDRYRFIKGDGEARTKALRGEWSLSYAARVVEGRKCAKHAASLVDKDLDAKVMLEKILTTAVRFGVLYVDPPWDYGMAPGSVSSAFDPRRHYSTMTLQRIAELPVAKVAAPNAVLFLWSPSCLEEDALSVMRAWGFTHCGSVIWHKNRAAPTMGMVRPDHEVLLLGVRGAGVPHGKRQLPTSVHYEKAPGGVHSRKPAWFAEQIERLFPNKQVAKIELFCRQARPGWVCLGNDRSLVAAPSGQSAKGSAPVTRAKKAKAIARRHKKAA